MKAVEMMDHGVSMLSKKKKAGRSDKRGRKKKGLESEPDIRIMKTQSGTNYRGAGRRGGCGVKINK